MDKEAQDLWHDLVRTKRWERKEIFIRRLELHRDLSHSNGRLNTGFYVEELYEQCAKELAKRGRLWWDCCQVVLEAGKIRIDHRNMPQLEHDFAQEILKDHQSLLDLLNEYTPKTGIQPRNVGWLDSTLERGKAQFHNQLSLTRVAQRARLLRLEELLAAPRYSGILKAWRASTAHLPSDRNASIREGISALEGAAKLLVRRGSATLGEALKELRADGRIAAPLVDAIEKVWGFSNSRPGIRHGSASPTEMLQAEAQFAYETIGAAIQVMLVLDRTM